MDTGDYQTLSPAASYGGSGDDLEQLSDEELHALSARAASILRAREEARTKEAIAEIKRIANENNLAVDVGPPKRRRGRPRKSEQRPPAAIAEEEESA